MNDKNLIHVRLGYREALESKGDIVSSKLNLIKVSRTIRNYKEERLKELKLKLKLFQKLKQAVVEIRKLQIELPKLKLPEILKENKISEEPKQYHESNLELELQEIQNKLRALGS